MRPHGERPREHRQNGIGTGIRRYIEVRRLMRQQQVAHASPREIRLIASSAQPVDDALCGDLCCGLFHHRIPANLIAGCEARVAGCELLFTTIEV